MTQKARRFRTLENRFLAVYSAWQETHRLELATESLRMLGELISLNPRYSFRHSFDRAF